MTVAVAVAAAKTSTGTQSITTTDLGGLTPKAALFIYSRGTSDGATAADGAGSFGVCDATSQWAVASYVKDAGGGVMGDVGKTNKCVVALKSGTGTEIHSEAGFSAFITNGVTINWTTATADGWLLTVVLFGGADWSAKVGVTTSVASVSVDVGFEPSFVLFGGVNGNMSGAVQSGSRARYAFGGQAWNAAGRTGAAQCTWTWPFSDEQDFCMVNDVACGIQFEAIGGIYSIDVARYATGFTFGNGYQEADDWGYMALRWEGGETFCKLLEITSATGAQSFTGFGFQPQFALILPSANVSNGAPENRRCGIVAATETKLGGFSTSARLTGGGGGFIEKSVAIEGTIRLVDQSLADFIVGTLTSFDADGLTLNITTAPAIARQWPVLAFGPDVGGGGSERLQGWVID